MAAYKDEARGTWYVSFHYNDWTGKNKRKLKRGFRTRREALEYEQKFLLQQATNLDMMFADFYKLYEEDLKPNSDNFILESTVLICQQLSIDFTIESASYSFKGVISASISGSSNFKIPILLRNIKSIACIQTILSLDNFALNGKRRILSWFEVKEFPYILSDNSNSFCILEMRC